MTREWSEALRWALALLLLSWLVVRAGIVLGEHLFPPQAGHPKAGEIQTDLFRFDSVYYQDIAEHGYSYNGDPGSSPNLVFAPLFPVLVRALSFLPGVDLVSAGFALNKVLLFLALTGLYLFLRVQFSPWRTRLVLLAMSTAAGAYAFHAYYSESTMLLALALVLLSHQRQWWWTLALAVSALGASRLTAAPIAVTFALIFIQRAWQDSSQRWRWIAAAAVCGLGLSIYLATIAIGFGNPFVLFPEIQRVSWGRFHPETDAFLLLSGGYIFRYWWAALSKGLGSFTDIQTLNLVWTTLALGSGAYLISVWRRSALTSVFLPYLLFIYATNTSSEFLISAHRFFTPMLPIFLMASALPLAMGKRWGRWACGLSGGLLLLLNLAYGLLHTAAFNQGVWFWF